MSLMQPISPKELNAVLKPHAKSEILRPLLIFSLDVALYIFALHQALTTKGWILATVWGIAAGLTSGMLFVVGHDACHGSFTRKGWLNQLLGRIVFLPTFHSFSLWNHGHNRLHHRYTNLITRDYVYTPLSKPEYDAMPFYRRLIYRLERNFIGHGVYYARVWWNKMLLAKWAYVPNPNLVHTLDSWLVLSCLVAFVSWLWWAFGVHGIIFGFVIPQAMWNWLMGFLIYQHHTEPHVAWFSNEQEWDYVASQVDCTVHVKFPRIINFLLHNIMEHTAHHALTPIPLYKLKGAQDDIQTHFGQRMAVVDWTPLRYLDTLRRCQLYDYQSHRWLNYQGEPMTPSTVPDSLMSQVTE